MALRSLLFLTLSFLFFACHTTRETLPQNTPPVTNTDDGQIEVILLHINDVYEIAPLEGGAVGGMARVETIRKKLKKENPNVLFVHAGDFLNPSLLGTLKYEGERIKGRQMVEVLNAMDLDLVTFGNHEFDLDEDELQARINESEFTWLATNIKHVKDGKNQNFAPTDPNSKAAIEDLFVWPVKDADGTEATIGFFGATINSNPKDYVLYDDPYVKAIEAAEFLSENTDLVLGLTHLEIVQDLKLGGMLNGVPLLMGGHDHDHMIDSVGATVVAKADANAKSIYIHRIELDLNAGTHSIRSEWMPITDEIQDDPGIAGIVEKWQKIQDAEIRQVIPDPYEVIYQTKVPLDGRESSIRNHQTNLGGIIAQGMLESSRHNAVAGFFNGGSVRIDDQLSGDIMAIDLFRALPYGGKVVDIRITGDLLKKTLNTGLQNKGTGGYLQWANIEYRESDQTWLIRGQEIKDKISYNVVVSDFLLTGLETRLDFFTPDNPGIEAVHKPTGKNPDDLRIDIRKAVAAYLKSY